MDKISRRGVLGASGGVLAAGAVAAAGRFAPTAGAAARPQAGSGSSGVRFRWLGNNAWEIRFGTTTILTDPWLTRFHTGTYTPSGADPRTPLTVDPDKIDPYIDRADLILVGHGHYDHITDIPYIARKTKATVAGTESHVNMLRALGAPEDQMSVVRGGEYMQFDDYTVEVFPSLHSMTGDRRQIPFPGTRPGPPPPRPTTIADLVEGETLAYQITAPSGFRILALSTANFDERAVQGLRPDLAIVATGGSTVHDYAARLMRALGNPDWVLPTHWDDFDYPLSQPAKDWGALATTRDAIQKASPRTRFITVDHLKTFTP